MAELLSLPSRKEAGPSSFVTSQDFISFDDVDDDDDANDASNSNVEDSDELLSRQMGARNNDQHESNTSYKANGKKRKQYDQIDVDSKSKREKKREVARGTPWCEYVDFDKCITSADVLHDEMMAFADWISPTPREHETRKMVIQLISRAIFKQWPDAEVRAFGSQNTQLYMPQGDIDLVVISPRMEQQRTESVLRSMAVCLRRNNLATVVQVIGRAKVPIIKFTCTHGKYKVDISINHTNGIDASQFVADWLHRCPALRPLIMATKLLLNQRGMSEVFSGGLGSYSVICMVISHIQMHPKVQRGEIDPSRNLGVLFLEFLELFGKNFGYDEVGISIRGRGSYFRKAARGWKDDRRPFALSIEDPGDISNDIAKGSFSILNVRQTYGGAFDIMTAVMCQRATSREKESSKKGKKQLNGHQDEDEEAREALLNNARLGESDKDPDSLLGNIIGVNREMIKARRDINALWESGTLQYLLGRSPPPKDPIPHKSSREFRREEREPPRAKRGDEEARTILSIKGSGIGKQPLIKAKTMLDNGRMPKETTKEIGESNNNIKANTKEGISYTSKGTQDSPVIVLDSSSDSHLQKSSSKANLILQSLDEEESSPIHQRDEEEDAEADSKYSTHEHNKKRKKKASRLDEFAKVAPKTFILDESASEEDDDGDASMRKRVEKEAAQKRRKMSSKEDEEKRRKRKEYWESKGNTVTEISSDEQA